LSNEVLNINSEIATQISIGATAFGRTSESGKAQEASAL
jgi:hypothetical protein